MTDEEKTAVQAYVESIATVSIPDPEKSPRLFELVQQFQTHTCRDSCKTGRNKVERMADGTTVTRWVPVTCRYGFPKKPSPAFHLHDPDTAVKKLMKTGQTNELYALQRQPDEIHINNYHPVILLLLAANMDIKVSTPF